MTLTNAKAGAVRPSFGMTLLTNYYWRGAIALAAVFLTLAVGASDGTPMIVGIAVWLGLFLFARFYEGYTGSDRKP